MKVGIVGSGFGVRAHLPAFVAHPSFEVVALASPHSAQNIAKARNIPQAFTSCEAMLKGCDVDLVSIAAPPFTHHEDVLASLGAGKHVICEKPLALNVRQAEEMAVAAQKAGTVTAIMHEFRFVPQHVAIKELIANNHLQPLREIEVTQLATFLGESVERKSNWWMKRDLGGGITGALLSHLIDLATWLAGRPPVKSLGYERTAVPKRKDANGSFTTGVADGAFALIDYGDGLVARLAVDGTVAIDSYTCAVHAQNRTAVASGSSIFETQLFAIDSEEASELDCKQSKYEKFKSVDRHVPLVMELLDQFLRRVETGTGDIPTFEDGLQTQRVLESVGYGKP